MPRKIFSAGSFLVIFGVLILGLIAIPATKADTPAQPFGTSLSVTDASGDVQEWVELTNGTFIWGPAPSWASYCDILQINASENDQNYSIAVGLASTVNTSRYLTGFAGIRVFVNLTENPNAVGTLQLVLGGDIYTAGQVTGHLSYAQIQNSTNATETYNATDIATITDTVVNFSFPQSLIENMPDLQTQVVPLAQWSVVVWSWDFFNSTAEFESGNMFWDGYGDPGFQQNWGSGTFTFPSIGGYDLIAIIAAMGIGVAVIRRKLKNAKEAGVPA
ncbi:MAG TPA: hypothetical protein VKK79_14830 [Candidatus Lokiarchaeia archaeon]|nr:hypothetical protein [Candidatus Lokiarchaeia archaeon]